MPGFAYSEHFLAWPGLGPRNKTNKGPNTHKGKKPRLKGKQKPPKETSKPNLGRRNLGQNENRKKINKGGSGDKEEEPSPPSRLLIFICPVISGIPGSRPVAKLSAARITL